ncbi:MAG TPA: nuclear transport factor 2 family protein [Candidatus Binatia bacterium]|nr:nuclear transport factor 2 family protein [Candidatus Binatia bacterium]
MTPDAAALRTLLDRAGIQDLLVRYARGVDRRDLGLVASCFTPDATYAGALATGPIGEALAALGAAMPRYAATLHLLGTQTIAVYGDTARCTTDAVAHHRFADGGHDAAGVRYRDDLVRCADGWRIRRRVVETLWRRRDVPVDFAGGSA